MKNPLVLNDHLVERFILFMGSHPFPHRLRLKKVEYSRNSLFTGSMSSAKEGGHVSIGRGKRRVRSTQTLHQRASKPTPSLRSEFPQKRICVSTEPNRHSSSNSMSENELPKAVVFKSNPNSQGCQSQVAVGLVHPTVNPESVLREM